MKECRETLYKVGDFNLNNNENVDNNSDGAENTEFNGIKEVAKLYKQYGYYIEQYTSECIYSLVSDLAGNLIEVDLENWIMDVPTNFNLYSAIVGDKGSGKSTTIRKFKIRIYRKVVSELEQSFSSQMVGEVLSTKDFEGFAPTGEGLTRELDGINQRVIRIIGTEFGKTMSQMYGNSYLALLPEVFIKLHDGDAINRWLSSGNIHIDEGKFTTMMIDIHPGDLNNKGYIDGGLGRRTNLAIYKGKLDIPKLPVETARDNRKKVKEIDVSLVHFLSERFKRLFRGEGDPKPKVRFNDEALQILLDLFQKYGTDSDIAMKRYPTVAKYAILEAILTSPLEDNVLTVDKRCIDAALIHLNQYSKAQEELAHRIEISLPEGRVDAVVDYVNRNSYEKDGEIKLVMHKDLLQNLNLNARQAKEAETEVAQSRRCWVISYKPPKKKPSRVLARGDIEERVVRAFFDSELIRNGWDRYEIEGDT